MTKLTPTEQKKARRDAFFALNVDLARSVKSVTKEVETEKLENTLTAYMSLFGDQEEEKPETIEVNTDILQQMALMAGMALSRIIVERHK